MEEKIKKKNFFSRLHESKWKQVLFFCISMTVIMILYMQAGKILHRQFEIVSDDFSWVYQVDSIESKDKQLEIKGWAFALNQNAGENQFEIILHNVESGKNVYSKISYEAREDVNEYFLCEYDYTQSGFTAVLSNNKLKDGVYEILLRSEDSKKAYATNVYYADGKMTFVNPEEFVPLNVAGTDLETVVENGVLRVYRPDYGMYVYQYEGELYWIAESWYDFVEDDTYVQYQMDTTQVENLPKDRLDRGHYWSNLGFRFLEKELTEWNTGSYRVTKSALPTEYSVTRIYTGNHTDGIPEAYKSNYTLGWIWKTNFRPWYEFDKD